MQKEKDHPYDYIRLGKRIQARRKEIGLTQEELSEKIGCSLTHLSRLETGSPPGLDMLIRLSYLLGYSLDEMLGLYPSTNPFVHEICDLFLVHSEDEQNFALWLMQFFFYVMDQKEFDFKLRKRKSKSTEQMVIHLLETLPGTPPEDFIKQFSSLFSHLLEEPTSKKTKKRKNSAPTDSELVFNDTTSDQPHTVPTSPSGLPPFPFSASPPLYTSSDSESLSVAEDVTSSPLY